MDVDGEGHPGVMVPWRGRDAFFVIVLVLGALVPISLLVSGAGEGVLLVVGAVVLASVTVLWASFYRRPLLLLGERFHVGPRAVAVGVLPGLALLVIQLAVAWVVVGLFGADLPEASGELGELSQDGVPSVGLILAVVLVAPMAEELFFRGLLLQGLARSFGRWPAILVSGALFGIAHLAETLEANIIAVGTGALVGVLLGWLFLRYRNLAVPILAHSVINAGVLVLLMASV